MSSISKIESNSFSSYEKSINFAKQYVTPRNIDLIEIFAPLQISPIIVSIALQSFQIYQKGFKNFIRNIFTWRFPTKGEWILSFALNGASIASYLAYKKYIKTPFIQQKLQKIVENSQTTKLLPMLLFRTSNDWNGVFISHKNVSDYQNLAQKYSIDVVEVSSLKQLESALKKLENDKYERIEFHAHANQNSIILSPQITLTKDSKKIFKWIHEHSKKGAVIGLNCCNAASGEENIAQAISKDCPNTTVYASANSIHGLTGSKYDENGIPSFNNGIFREGKDTTRIYQNGQLIIDPGGKV